VQAARDLAARPVRWYATEEEAWSRYRRVSGLSADIAPGEEWLARGALEAESGWRLAQDPRTFAVAGAPFAPLAASATAPVLLARGERDPMVSLQELQTHAPRARDIPGAGHNVHVEDPAAVVALLEQLAAGV
jgi:pimeloyl-ACP methyl ester carboxylesterase